MGISKREIIEYFCDLCLKQMEMNENIIDVIINSGDRDVGPSVITAHFSLDIPYGCSNGIVCRECQIKYFRKYFDSND